MITIFFLYPLPKIQLFNIIQFQVFQGGLYSSYECRCQIWVNLWAFQFPNIHKAVKSDGIIICYLTNIQFLQGLSRRDG